MRDEIDVQFKSKQQHSHSTNIFVGRILAACRSAFLDRKKELTRGQRGVFFPLLIFYLRSYIAVVHLIAGLSGRTGLMGERGKIPRTR